MAVWEGPEGSVPDDDRARGSAFWVVSGQLRPGKARARGQLRMCPRVSAGSHAGFGPLLAPSGLNTPVWPVPLAVWQRIYPLQGSLGRVLTSSGPASCSVPCVCLGRIYRGCDRKTVAHGTGAKETPGALPSTTQFSTGHSDLEKERAGNSE